MANRQAARQEGEDQFRLRYESIEARRQRILVYLGNGVAGIFLLGFGIANISAGRTPLAIFTLVHAGITLFNILLFRITRNHDWAGYGFGYGILALFTYLIASGGVDNTGPLWAFPMIASTIVLLGARRGLFVVATMFCLALILFLVPLPMAEVAAYSTTFKIRFVAAFAVVSLFTWLHEYARAKSQTELIRVSAQLDRLSHTDTLTALPNRRYMIDRLEAENSRFHRHHRPYSIVYGDIDNFKAINDDCGHQTGDAVLQTVAQTLRASVRQHDELSRWGGEEFLLLLPETDAGLALEVAEKLRAAVAAIDYRHEGMCLPLTMSFGVHTVDAEGKIDAFIHCADQNLYLAKKGGRNRVVAAQKQAA